MIVKSFVRQPFCVISIIVMVQYPHDYEQNPSRIAYDNVFLPDCRTFSYNQNSKCSDLLKSYLLFYISQILHFPLYLHLT